MTQSAQPAKRRFNPVLEEEERLREEDAARYLDPVNPCVPILQLYHLIDNELQDPVRQQVEAHLASCPVCRGSVAGIRKGRNHPIDPFAPPLPGTMGESLLKEHESFFAAQQLKPPDEVKPG